MQNEHGTHLVRRGFIATWVLLCVLKLALAAQLPLFVDEAFYWQEGRHLALAYSDLPGLTAWLTRLGDALVPGSVLALRAPFLLMGGWMPWLLVRMSTREFDARTGWWAGVLFLLLPLAGTMGLLALPDVPLLLATLLCLDAGLRLLRKVEPLAVTELALGLGTGGLTHYRFAAVIVVGLAALLVLREGRRVLQSPQVWAAIGIGALAWLPLLLWNLQHADAGLHFQLVERHPWAFSSQGVRLGVASSLLATPLLLLAMLVAAWRGLHDRRVAVRYLALSGSLITCGFLVLGFFADRQRVSFHWPLPGHVALLPLVPAVLLAWRCRWRLATVAMAALGLAAVLAYCQMASLPSARAWAAKHGVYPGNFAGWTVLADHVRIARMALPANTRLLAGDFKLGAELGFALDDANIAVLQHPLNRKHGREAQLREWGLLHADAGSLAPPMLLVTSPSHAGFDGALAYRQRLCAQMGALPPPQVLTVDAGGKQVWLFAIIPGVRHDGCPVADLTAIKSPLAAAVAPSR